MNRVDSIKRFKIGSLIVCSLIIGFDKIFQSSWVSYSLSKLVDGISVCGLCMFVRKMIASPSKIEVVRFSPSFQCLYFGCTKQKRNWRMASLVWLFYKSNAKKMSKKGNITLPDLIQSHPPNRIRFGRSTQTAYDLIAAPKPHPI